jgi:hypothetical protein
MLVGEDIFFVSVEVHIEVNEQLFVCKSFASIWDILLGECMLRLFAVEVLERLSVIELEK